MSPSRVRAFLLFGVVLLAMDVSPASGTRDLAIGTLHGTRPDSCWYVNQLRGLGDVTIDNRGAFADGDTVLVWGERDVSLPCRSFSHLSDNEIQPYRGADFGCGTLMIDPKSRCGSVSIDGWPDRFMLESYVGFGAGAFIQVRGTIGRGLGLPDYSGIWLFDTRLTACGDTLGPIEPVDPVSWGRIKSRYR